MFPKHFSPCPITLSLLVAVLTTSDLGAQTNPSSSASKPDASEEVHAPRRPTTSGDLPTRVSIQLRVAFPLAVKRLRTVPSCQALFEELGPTASRNSRRPSIGAPRSSRRASRGFDWPRRLPSSAARRRCSARASARYPVAGPIFFAG